MKTVDEILDAIDRLPDNDRALFERRLNERFEAEWRREAETARSDAAARGIDEAAIEAAIREYRYGT